MAVFANHYSYLQPGTYLFLLSPTRFDTRSLPDGVYDLVVTATDIRSKSSSRSLRFTIRDATLPAPAEAAVDASAGDVASGLSRS